MQSWLSRGQTARIVSGFHSVLLRSWKALFEEGAFTSDPRGAGGGGCAHGNRRWIRWKE